MTIMFKAYNNKGEALFIGSSKDEDTARKRLANKSWHNEIAKIKFFPFSKNTIEKAIFRERPKYHPAWQRSYRS